MLAEEITNLIDKKGYLLADGATGTNLFDMVLSLVIHLSYGIKRNQIWYQIITKNS